MEKGEWGLSVLSASSFGKNLTQNFVKHVRSHIPKNGSVLSLTYVRPSSPAAQQEIILPQE
jgi:hypothetical protein